MKENIFHTILNRLKRHENMMQYSLYNKHDMPFNFSMNIMLVN